MPSHDILRYPLAKMQTALPCGAAKTTSNNSLKPAFKTKE